MRCGKRTYSNKTVWKCIHFKLIEETANRKQSSLREDRSPTPLRLDMSRDVLDNIKRFSSTRLNRDNWELLEVSNNQCNSDSIIHCKLIRWQTVDSITIETTIIEQYWQSIVNAAIDWCGHTDWVQSRLFINLTYTKIVSDASAPSRQVSHKKAVYSNSSSWPFLNKGFKDLTFPNVNFQIGVYSSCSRHAFLTKVVPESIRQDYHHRTRWLLLTGSAENFYESKSIRDCTRKAEERWRGSINRSGPWEGCSNAITQVIDKTNWRRLLRRCMRIPNHWRVIGQVRVKNR